MHVFDASILAAPMMSVTRRLATEIETLSQSGREMHFLGVGYPNPEASDATTYTANRDAFLRHTAAGLGITYETFLTRLYGYTDTKGPKPPREVFAQVYGRDFGVAMDPKHLVPCIGGTGGIDLLCALFESSGKPIAYLVDAPCYPGFTVRAARYPGAAFYSVDIRDDGPDPEALRAQIRKARRDGRFVAFYYTVPDGHNPGGISFSQARREAIYRVLQEEDVLAVEDVPYTYISHTEQTQRPKPFMAIDTDGRIIHIFTASKIGLPGPRVAFVYAPGKIRVAGGAEVNASELITTMAASANLLHNPFSLWEFAAYLHDEQFQPRSLWPLADAKNRVYGENRAIFLGALQTHLGPFPELFSWTTPGAGFFSVFTFLGGGIADAVAFAGEALREDGVVTVPMVDFYTDDARGRNHRIGHNQLRLSFSYTRGTGEERRRQITRAAEQFCETVLRKSGLPLPG